MRPLRSSTDPTRTCRGLHQADSQLGLLSLICAAAAGESMHSPKHCLRDPVGKLAARLGAHSFQWTAGRNKQILHSECRYQNADVLLVSVEEPDRVERIQRQDLAGQGHSPHRPHRSVDRQDHVAGRARGRSGRCSFCIGTCEAGPALCRC